MTCMLHKMSKHELVQFAQQNANTPLEKALLKHVDVPKITDQRKLRVKFWSTHRNLKRRKGGAECQSLQAQLAWTKFIADELAVGNISKYLAVGAILKYQ